MSVVKVLRCPSCARSTAACTIASLEVWEGDIGIIRIVSVRREWWWGRFDGAGGGWCAVRWSRWTDVARGEGSSRRCLRCSPQIRIAALLLSSFPTWARSRSRC